jgi:DNA-binding response OmpR family regulator
MMARGVVLLVEDEVALVEMLREYLMEQGYEIEVAMNGGDAVVLAGLRRPDAVLLDVNLPGESGADVLRRLRELDETMTVVMLSGADDAIAGPLLEAGAFDYVRKPFRFDTLDATVRLAVAVGMKKPPLGVVLALHSDRRAGAGAAEETPPPACEVCAATITDVKNAIADGSALVHAACWRRRHARGV